MILDTKLNLNKHPSDITSGQLIAATNMILSDDGLLQTEHGIKENIIINEKLETMYPKGYTIINIIPCNEMLILFVLEQNKKDAIIFKYKEKDKSIECTDIRVEYHNGKFVNNFTYINENLVITFSEYDADEDVPIRTIDFDKKGKQDEFIQSNISEVKIPTMSAETVVGSLYKGWWFIYVRYKIKYKNYTKWYNTNESILIDECDRSSILAFNQIITTGIGDKESAEGDMGNNSGRYTEFGNYITVLNSNDFEYTNKTIYLNITNLDHNYDEFQIGLINVNKTHTKYYISNDINTNITSYIISANNIKETTKVINDNYYNYYNVKALSNYKKNNYIANYKEHDLIDISNITATIDFKYANGFQSKYINELLNKFQFIVGTIANKSTLYIKGTDSKGDYVYLINDTNYINNKYDTIKSYIDTQLIFKEDNKESYSALSYLDLLSDDDNAMDSKTYENTEAENLFFELFGDNPDVKHVQIYTMKYINKNINYNKNIYANENNDLRYTTIKYYYKTNEYYAVDKNGEYKLNNIRYTNEVTYQTEIDGIGDDLRKIDRNRKFTYKRNAVAYMDKITFDDTIEHIRTVLEHKVKYKYKYDIINTIYPCQYYKFYIHFVNRYGEYTNGYDICDFNLAFAKYPITIVDKKILAKPYTQNSSENESEFDFLDNTNPLLLEVHLSSFPKGYIGFFVSNEKFESQNLGNYYNINSITEDSKNRINMYVNENINYKDKLYLYYDYIKEYNLIDRANGQNKYWYNMMSDDNSVSRYFKHWNSDTYNDTYNTRANAANNRGNAILYSYVNNSYTQHYITLLPADTTENIGFNSNIQIENETAKFVSLYRDINHIYNNNNKVLIPCSNVSYNTTVLANTKTGFIDYEFYIFFNNNYFDNTNKRYHHYNIHTPRYIDISKFTFKSVVETPVRYLRFKNKPVTVIYPSAYNLLNGDDDGYQWAAHNLKGIVIEAKNMVDMFKDENLPIGEAYVNTLTNFNNNNIHIKFPKTIRRSNNIQDESVIINSKFFEQENYKNIIENKGEIIKITSIGYIQIIHTQYSIFMFNATDKLNSTNNGVQLANSDIWDIDYKEVLTSDLGQAGISEADQAIYGEFGYIFYCPYDHHIYRLDNMNISKIDEEIHQLLLYIDNSYNINIGNDVLNNRLLFNFYNDENTIVISYNYKLNKWVSTHTYKYNKAYNTVNDIYFLNRDKNKIYNYTNDNYNTYELGEESVGSSIDIIFNNEYEKMKFIEYIKYKIYKIEPKGVNVISPVEGHTQYYAGKTLRVYSEFCNTGDIDVSDLTADDKLNAVTQWSKPYWRMGNFHFNALRDKLNDNIAADNKSQIYGNWFVVHLEFNSPEQIEIESIDCKFRLDTV